MPGPEISRLSIGPARHLTGRKQYLYCDVIATRTKQNLYSIGLMPVEREEEHLDAGRFRHFVHTSQDYAITLSIERSFVSLNAWMTEVVEWITDHTHAAWSLAISMEHMHQGSYRFSFASARVAVEFALVWV